ncbi:MAG: ATP-dependent helicase/nuclease subunit A [Gammaproteobacteria bacterium]|jgi:ATP-dependent helicase/nuclease subunit A
MQTDDTIADAWQREQALDPNRSFIVKAPAGSGKTSLLVARFLTLLAGAKRPEEILAITFTRKATAEMRARVLDALAAGQGPPPEDPHEQRMYALAVAVTKRDAEMGWQLGHDPQRLRIQTIDALCGSLARRLPVLSGLGGSLKTLEDSAPSFQAAACRTLELIEDKDVGSAVARVLMHVDGNMASFERLIAQMLARREQWVHYLALDDRGAREELESGMRATVETALLAAQRAVPDNHRDGLLAMAQFGAQRAHELQIEPGLLPLHNVDRLPPARSDKLAQWKAIAHLLLTAQGALRKRVMGKVFVAKETPLEYGTMRDLLEELAHSEATGAALAAVRALPAPEYDDQQWQTLLDLFAVLKLAMAMLRLEFAQTSSSDFTEQVLAASQALGDEQAPTDLTLALDHAIRHVLVDEFQDTSVAHFTIINKLIAGWAQADGHTLFVVGDPMQSIYRFREAELGLFLGCYRDGLQSIDLEPLALSANFRSRAGIVDWVNRAFVDILPTQDDPARAAAAFERSEAIRGAGTLAAVEVHPLREASVEAQAECVAQCVAESRESNPNGGVAILLRARTHAPAIISALSARGLSWRGIDLQPLFGVPAVRDLHALTCAVLHPLDRASWLAVLRAPWCGLTLDDLEALASASASAVLVHLLEDTSTLRRVSADGRARLARVAPVLVELMAQRGQDRLAALIRRAWRALGGPACLDGASIDDPRRYLELLAQAEREFAVPDPDELARRVAQLYAAPRPGVVDVEIMTIHRAKGLEFDVVLLPALERMPRGEPSSMLAWSRTPVDAGSSLLLAPLPPPEGEDHSPIHRFVRGLEGEKRRLETARLLYVACTRAREQMHLFANVRWKQDNDAAVMPARDSLLAYLWPAVASHFERLPASGTQVSPANASDAPAHIVRLPTNWCVGELPRPLQGLDTSLESDFTTDAIEYSWAGRSARLVGVVAHAALRRISEEGLGRWNRDRVLQSTAQWRGQLRDMGLEGEALDSAAQSVVDALLNTLADQRGAWLLSAQDAARSEFAISGVEDGILVNAVLDRTFVDEQGMRWIIDYKTGVHRGGALEAFLDREQERYRTQLERYAKLMHEFEPRQTRLALYFPAFGAWREWPWQASTPC